MLVVILINMILFPTLNHKHYNKGDYVVFDLEFYWSIRDELLNKLEAWVICCDRMNSYIREF